MRLSSLEQGEILLKATIESVDADIVNIRFSVTDSGIGLTKVEQESLFQPFVQADGSISRRFGGTGLGLSICKRLVEIMNGRIGLSSGINEGSTFWFTLPLEIRSDSSILSTKNELRSTKVLIVDPDLNTRDNVEKYVEAWRE